MHVYIVVSLLTSARTEELRPLTSSHTDCSRLTRYRWPGIGNGNPPRGRSQMPRMRICWPLPVAGCLVSSPLHLVELRGLEPLNFSLRTLRQAQAATFPSVISGASRAF